ncbi:hypothetical protein J6S88_05955 [bacterium]|nr:hypothetical protein [bacterium]
MINPVNISKIYSTLGSNSSIVPLAIKDIANSLGITAGAYVVGKQEESADRFIDEFGTQAIWLFGIPTFKKLIDWTVFKPLKLDNKIDVRILKDKDVFEKAKEFAATPEIRNSLLKAEKNAKFIKGLAIGKFAVSTALTIWSYSALTKYRHKKTEEKVRKNILEEQAKKQAQNQENMSFKGGLSGFMFNPVQNLMIVDASISGERLYHARSLQDFLGYVVKEGTFWIFMYYASQKIQKVLENKALKNGKTISMDSRVIESADLKNSLANGNLQKSLNEFMKNKTDAEIYEFLNKTPENDVIKFAKQSDIIQTLEATDGFWNKLFRKIGLKGKLENADKIDTRAYIDMDELKGFAKKLQNLQNQYNTSGENIDLFCKRLVSLKRKAVLKGMGSCILALGVLTPTIMVAIRFLRNDKGFQVREKIEQELAENKEN